MINEYGGYLPLELAHGREYYHGNNVIAVDKGRSAILLAALDGKFSTIYIPYYTCPTIAEFIRRESDIKIKYYNIDTDFKPINVRLGNNECILWTNYFGIVEKSSINEMIDFYGERLILDSTQSFFSEPRGNSYFIYSCRKFFGVSDGGYLWKNQIYPYEFSPISSLDASVYLLSAYEKGTNDSYDEYKKNENIVENRGICGMSSITHRILQSISYQKVEERRKNNFVKMHSLLKKHNMLSINPDNIDIPQVYPLLLENDILREHLVKNRIYVPQWWKFVLNSTFTNEFEKKMAKYLFPLPIDQRYSDRDLEYIYQIIEQVI